MASNGTQNAKHMLGRDFGSRFYFLKNVFFHHKRTTEKVAHFFYTDNETTIETNTETSNIETNNAETIYEQAEFGQLARESIHDLVNHLSAAKLYLNLAEKEKDIKVNKKFNGIKEAIRIMSKTEKFVLSIKKQINHHEENRLFSVNKEIKQIITLMEYKATKLNVQICLSDDQTIKLYGNSTEFGRIFLNLIGNAIESYAKAPTDNKKIVKIYILRRPLWFYFVVKDYGGGIRPENLDKIFAEFFTTKQNCGGSGIGLFSSKKIIENKFHGQIKVRSCWRKGTSFIIKIPRDIKFKAKQL